MLRWERAWLIKESPKLLGSGLGLGDWKEAGGQRPGPQGNMGDVLGLQEARQGYC